jgi:hypothetical protein
MRRIVVDAATVLTWFDASGAEARREYEAGEFAAFAPPRIYADLLAEIARRPETSPKQLERVAGELSRIGLQVRDAPLEVLAGWIARGLDAELAPYAALAEHLDMRLEAGHPVLRQRAQSLIGR